ncbi:hypothetical protein K457DRAFT_493107 [Linnemannia elongata AG-77]|uniref:Uncharacterized protein n=1 Tax=Linnemannia elongata AG-77 TaxID=1314771 RepID=A0A197KGC9_9FUNG|nr:hypothetical protein K457DRAFT_493107 [Linnemannia elongata AG-77]
MHSLCTPSLSSSFLPPLPSSLCLLAFLFPSSFSPLHLLSLSPSLSLSQTHTVFFKTPLAPTLNPLKPSSFSYEQKFKHIFSLSTNSTLLTTPWAEFASTSFSFNRPRRRRVVTKKEKVNIPNMEPDSSLIKNRAGTHRT